MDYFIIFPFFVKDENIQNTRILLSYTSLESCMFDLLELMSILGCKKGFFLKERFRISQLCCLSTYL